MSRQAISPNPQSYSSARANPLSIEEVNELSGILARLGALEDASSVRVVPAIGGATHNVVPGLLGKAKEMYATRQRRTSFFPRKVFGETGWEILLVLYIHDGLTRLCIRDIGQLIDVPATTVLRWLKVLEDENFIVVRKHHQDLRVSILDLTEFGRRRFTAFMTELVG